MDNGAASLRVVTIKESFCTELSQKYSIASKNTRVLTVGCYQKLVIEVANAINTSENPDIMDSFRQPADLNRSEIHFAARRYIFVISSSTQESLLTIKLQSA